MSDFNQGPFDYWGVIWRVIPLLLIGGVMGLILNFSRLIGVSPWTVRLYKLVSVVLVGMGAAFVAALAMPLLPIPSTPEMDMLAAALAGACGKDLFDSLAWRVLRVERRVRRASSDGSDGASHEDSPGA